ncbi:hypothetical protein ABVT39_025621 [Epinephelus coioides]
MAEAMYQRGYQAQREYIEQKQRRKNKRLILTCALLTASDIVHSHCQRPQQAEQEHRSGPIQAVGRYSRTCPPQYSKQQLCLLTATFTVAVSLHRTPTSRLLLLVCQCD